MVKVRRRDGHASKRPAMRLGFVSCFFNEKPGVGESGIGWDFCVLRFLGEKEHCARFCDVRCGCIFWVSLWANVIWGRLLNPVTVMKASTVAVFFLAGPQML